MDLYIKKAVKGLLISLSFALLSTTQVIADEIEQPQSKPKIIALAPHIVEMLFEIGAGDLIIGTTDYADFPEQAKAIPRVGNYTKLSIEQILSLAPDIVIAWRTGNPSDDLARLKKMGVNIVYSNPTLLEDVGKEIATFAMLVGKEEQGKKIGQAFSTRLAKIKAQYKDKQPITIFYELWSRPLTTVANHSWLQQQLDICKASNPFIDSATDYPQVSVEQVVLSAPEIIIQPTGSGHNNADTVNWQQWPTIPAVKNNAFLTPNADKMHRMSSRVLDELTLLCQQIDSRRVSG
ncbi:cobalamin-binding protein [Thalassotalea piscium]|uniref:Vitamin B12 transport system substrate-binding protein n=1 Tax=Thalassotalea piscium TaxID=1230533 RepID=A0A7X0NKH9_9GAMM|nr:cobalamin-binding protein [Thalassotalea piscium]MBB6544986.1 vitamin B12 transport system substrate-binding protein [Thalassotalea piscium]